MAKFYWSATKVNIANYCAMRYYLRYVLHQQPLRLSIYVKGSLLHNLIEHFWDKLGTPEEVAKKSCKKKYFDSESFAKYGRGLWTRIVVADEKAKQKIAWRDKDEKWVIRNDMLNICKPLFNYLYGEERPIFTEMGFDFFVGKERFKGRIDEIQLRGEKIIVRDYKSGYPWVGEMKLKHDPQLTLYNVGVSTLIKSNEKVREVLGVKNLEEFMQGNNFISPNLEQEFFMIEALKKKKEPIFSSLRIEENFLEVLKMVKGVRKKAESGEIYPERGKKCDICDLKVCCDQELYNVGKGESFPESGQMVINFSDPFYMRKEKNPKPKIKKKILGQTRFNFRYNL